MTSTVVDLVEIEPCIAQLTMQDRINKNTFSNELISGLKQSFAAIGDNPRFKVVILTGYDTYFCSGGTKEGLLALNEGRATFADTNIYSLALQCDIPVISAMQGHGIGGGFALGLFSDFVVLSRESIYTANFMKYGFTPGMGSTLILNQKLGVNLAVELMLTADNFRGADLEKRGVPFPVLPRKEVVAYSLQLARKIADKSRLSLITLKNHLVKHLRSQLPGIIDEELEMHHATFHQPEVKDRINALFGKGRAER